MTLQSGFQRYKQLTSGSTQKHDLFMQTASTVNCCLVIPRPCELLHSLDRSDDVDAIAHAFPRSYQRGQLPDSLSRLLCYPFDESLWFQMN